jgi:hypothetical protein
MPLERLLRRGSGSSELCGSGYARCVRRPGNVRAGIPFLPPIYDHDSCQTYSRILRVPRSLSARQSTTTSPSRDSRLHRCFNASCCQCGDRSVRFFCMAHSQWPLDTWAARALGARRSTKGRPKRVRKESADYVTSGQNSPMLAAYHHLTSTVS